MNDVIFQGYLGPENMIMLLFNCFEVKLILKSTQNDFLYIFVTTFFHIFIRNQHMKIKFVSKCSFCFGLPSEKKSTQQSFLLRRYSGRYSPLCFLIISFWQIYFLWPALEKKFKNTKMISRKFCMKTQISFQF